MACIIADAGPLIAFAKIDQLEILRSLFEDVWIVNSVRDECLAKPGVDADAITQAIEDGWLVTRAAPESNLLLSRSLGVGECDSILLAMRNPRTSLLIVDDRLARRQALRLKLNIIGSVRLLVLAEERGLTRMALT